jgi:hypothetical protein
MMHSRRDLLAAAAGTVFASILLPLRAAAIPQLRVNGIELLPVRATSRTVCPKGEGEDGMFAAEGPASHKGSSVNLRQR